MRNQGLRTIVFGAGNRGKVYTQYALKFPDRLSVVAVAEPDAQRRDAYSELHEIGQCRQFADWRDALASGVEAEVVINATMDAMHRESSIATLEAGYDLLLEKPIAATMDDTRAIIDAAKRTGRKVMVCHVLRYAPVYSKIYDLIESGVIGDVVSVHSHENVAYHHMATAFVRGRWSRSDLTTPMIVAKCCHDTDLLAWFVGTDPTRVSSFGSLEHFTSANAPQGAPEFCLDGCPVAETCPYHAGTLYIRKRLWWHHIFLYGVKDEADGIAQLRHSPYGRCVYRCDNNQPDRQVVNVQFANGATASHTMVGLSSGEPSRWINVIGTRGDMTATLESNSITLRTYPAAEGLREVQEIPAVPVDTDGEPVGDGHGGADGLFTAAFVDFFSQESASSRTDIRHSLNGHLIAFAAEESRLSGNTVELEKPK